LRRARVAVVVHRDADDASRGRRCAHWVAEQPQKSETLAFGNEIHAIKQRVAEPREELDQRPAGIAGIRARPLRRVCGNSRNELVDEVVEAAIIE
jgi:hypothetical protein